MRPYLRPSKFLFEEQEKPFVSLQMHQPDIYIQKPSLPCVSFYDRKTPQFYYRPLNRRAFAPRAGKLVRNRHSQRRVPSLVIEVFHPVKVLP